MVNVATIGICNLAGNAYYGQNSGQSGGALIYSGASITGPTVIRILGGLLTYFCSSTKVVSFPVLTLIGNGITLTQGAFTIVDLPALQYVIGEISISDGSLNALVLSSLVTVMGGLSINSNGGGVTLPNWLASTAYSPSGCNQVGAYVGCCNIANGTSAGPGWTSCPAPTVSTTMSSGAAAHVSCLS